MTMLTRPSPALVVIGRPKRDRDGYRQWEEGGIAPQVVFETVPLSNRIAAIKKSLFYQRYGVEEFYVYEPDSGDLSGWLAQDGEFQPVQEMRGWVSKRLGIRFELEHQGLCIYDPEDRPFIGHEDLAAKRDQDKPSG